jgi:hypothetical protein
VPSPVLLALSLVLFVLLLPPTDRLRRAGWPPRALGAYLIGMLLLGLLVAELPGPARFLVPILIVGYVAPFVTARAGIDRLRRTRRPVVTVERPIVKQVHGPSRDVSPRDGPRTAGDEVDRAGASSTEDAEEGRTSRTE